MISVIIPTYNRPDLLERTLHSILTQNYDKEYEVIVCVDDTQEFVLDTHAVLYCFKNKLPIKVFDTYLSKKQEGWSVETYPYNVGIKNAIGDIVILNSADTLSVGNNLKVHETYHLNSDKIAVLGTTHALSQHVTETIDNYPWRENRKSLLFQGSCEDLFVGSPNVLAYTSNGSHNESVRPLHFQMSIKKKYLFEIRGFDEDYFGNMGYADNDIAYRLTQLGITFIYADDIVCIHQWHKKVADKLVPPNCDGHHMFNSIKVHASIKRNLDKEWGKFPK